MPKSKNPFNLQERQQIQDIKRQKKYKDSSRLIGEDFYSRYPERRPKSLPDRINKFIEKQYPKHNPLHSRGLTIKDNERENLPSITPPKTANTTEKQIKHHIKSAHKHYNLAIDNSWHSARHARYADIGDEHAAEAERLSRKKYPDLEEKRKKVWPG